jgi:site-specific recombinase XerD
MCKQKKAMKANVEAICYKVRPLKNGEFPLMLRITQSRKRKYVSIGLSIDPKFWDFDKNKPKRNCPNKEAINNLISAKLTEYNGLIMEMTTEQREYTPATLVSTLERKIHFESVDSFYRHLIAKLKNEDKLGNAEVYKYSLESLRHFTSNRLEIQFRDIDLLFLKRYEDWLKKRCVKETTISQLLRTLRSVYNKAIEENIVKRDYYPFHAYKVSKFDTATQKRAISKDEIQIIRTLDLSDSCFYMQLAKDMFLFSYFGAGINYSDIASLRFSDIKEGRVYYIRKKTGKPINFPLNEISKEIIEKYTSPFWDNNDYIFPILDAQAHKTER